MQEWREFPIIDDEKERNGGGEGVGESDEARDRRRRSLRANREVLRRTDLRRTRTYSWVGSLALVGSAVKLATLAWRNWRTGNAAALVVFGGLFEAALLAAILLAGRARKAGRQL